jgi:hypothetical protein
LPDNWNKRSERVKRSMYIEISFLASSGIEDERICERIWGDDFEVVFFDKSKDMDDERLSGSSERLRKVGSESLGSR